MALQGTAVVSRDHMGTLNETKATIAQQLCFLCGPCTNFYKQNKLGAAEILTVKL
jgi:hypothetical protein